MTVRVCKYCGKAFMPKPMGFRRKQLLDFCDSECCSQASRITRICCNCGQWFHGASKSLFCYSCRSRVGFRKRDHIKIGPLILCNRCGVIEFRENGGKAVHCFNCQKEIAREYALNASKISNSILETVEIKCVECGKSFDVRRTRGRVAKYCSSVCRERGRHKRYPERSKLKEREIHIYDVYFKCLGRCHICGKDVPLRLIGKRHPMAPSIDHVIPVSRGGKTVIENCLLAHLKCNIKKSNKGILQRMML